MAKVPQALAHLNPDLVSEIMRTAVRKEIPN